MLVKSFFVCFLFVLVKMCEYVLLILILILISVLVLVILVQDKLNESDTFYLKYNKIFFLIAFI